MLPFLFGSLSNWFTSKKQAPRAERRVKNLKARKLVKKLEMESLEERVTPVNQAFLYNPSNTLIGSFSGVLALQNAVAGAGSGGWSIELETGSYRGTDIGSGKDGLTVRAVTGQSPIVAAVFSRPITIYVDTPNVALRGLTIQDAGSPDAPVGVGIGAGADGLIIEQNTIEGFTLSNGRALDIEPDANNVTIRQNTLQNNGDGIRFNSFAVLNNLQVNENFIQNNTRYGINVEAGFSGSNNRFFDNSITGNTTKNIWNDSASSVDASGNWWGSNVESTIQGTFGGTGNLLVDFTPFMNFGTDTSASVGFQPDHSYLNVTTLGTQAGSTGRIQEGINSIQDGTFATGAARTLKVLGGTYTLTVANLVNKQLTLLGQQSGVDARTRGVVSETIVDASGLASYPSTNFDIQSGINSVTIDGFTLQGAQGGQSYGSVWMEDGTSGTIIRNNIIQNNSMGLLLDNDSAILQTQVTQNLFRNNTASGPGQGNDIYTDNFSVGGDLQNVLIQSNKFTNTVFELNTWAVGLGNVAGASLFNNITVNNNEITNHGRGAYAYGTGNLSFTNNTVTGATRYALGLFGNPGGLSNATSTVTGNTFSNNGKGVYLSDDTGSPAYTGSLTLSGNAYTTTGSQYSIYNDSATAVDATADIFNGQLASSASLAQQFVIVDTIVDGVDRAGAGLVRTKAGHVYVTPNSFNNDSGFTTPSTTPKIQRGINVATSGDTIDVAAGTYIENLNINKSVILLGPNSAISASTLAPRNPEAVIQASGATGRVVNLAASNVTVRGFTVTGYDPLAGTYTTLSSNTLTNVGEAFRNTGVINNLSIQNNIVQNAGIGVRLDGSSASTGNVIDNNYFHDIGAYDYGYAVSLRNNFYADVTNNRMTQVHSGLHTVNFSLAGTGTWLFQGNTVQAYAAGLWDNLQYSSADSLTVNNNNISVLSAVPTVPNYVDFNGKSIGMLFVSLQGTVSASVTNNVVNGMGYGAVFYNTESSNPIVLNSTNTISNSTVAGVLLTNIVGFNPIGTTVLGGGANNPTGVGKVVLDNINLTNNATGIINQGNSAFTAFGTSLTFQNGTTVTGGALGLSIIGDKAGVAGNTLANTTFTGQSGNYITLSSNALGSPFTYLDGTGATYDGVLGSGASLAQGFAIEDKVFHGTDASGLGYVRITPNLVYVTQNSGSIQRGVNVATSGNTLHVQGGPIAYAENVTVNKSLSILGPNAAINPNTGSRVTEAVVVPGVTETSLQASTSGTIFRVGSGSGHIDVTIKGLTIDGHNAALSSGRVLNGVQVNTGAGIVNSIGSFDANPGGYDARMIVQNNIIQNLERYGVLADGVVGGTPLGGTDVSFNKIDNLPSGNNFGGDRGRAAAFEENHYGTFSFNVVTRANVGWQDDNYYQPAPGGLGTVVTGNTISAYHRGIFHNLQYSNATNATITNNTLSAETIGAFPASSTNFGLELASIQGTVGVTATGNSVSGTVYGILLWNLPTTSTITVSGGTLTGNQYGVYVTNVDPQFGDAASSTVNLSGIAINNSSVAGIFVNDDPTNANSATISAGLNNITMSGGLDGLRVRGSDASLVGNTLANTSFTGQTGNYVSLTGSSGNGPVEMDGTGASYNGVAGGNTLSLANGFAIDDKINDYLDKNVAGSATVGFVRLRAGHVYVTQNSNSVQRGVNVALVNETVHVDTATIIEDVTIGTAGIKLFGAGPANTTISGAIGGSGSTIAIAASNVIVDGFTITREGNAVLTWNDPLNTVGLSIQGTGITNAEIRNNNFVGNRSGIDINNSNGHSIHNNVINDNRTGMIFRNQTNNISVYQNSIANNWTVGVLFLDGSGGTNSPLNQAVGSTFFNNNISGNWYGQIVDRQTGGALPAPGSNIKNFSGNWYGTITPVITNANSAEPGYAAQIPVIYGGVATAPGGQPDIAGPASANFDISPYLNTGTDTDPGTYGFQGDFSNLWVTSQLAQTGSTSRIQEGYDLVTDPAGPTHGIVHILGGSYAGDFVAALSKDVDLSPGTSPAQVIVGGNFTLNSGITLVMEMSGLAPGSGYDQFVVNGDVTLNNATLNATRTFGYTAGDNVVLIVNNSVNPTNGTFAGQAEGSTYTITGLPFTLTYQYPAPTGNDVALRLIPVNTVWVDDNWTYIDTDLSSTLSPGDTVNSPGGTVLGKIFGYNAFATIQSGVNGVATSGNVIVLTGTYDEAVLVNKPVVIDGQPDAGPLPIVTRNSGLQQALFTVTAPNVTLSDLELHVNRPFATAGIYASDTLADFSNLQLLNNTLTSFGTGSNFVTPDGNTSSPAIVLLSISTANLPVTVKGNTINAGPDPDGAGPLTASIFSRGIWLRRVVGSIGGASPSDGNSILATTQDLLVRFNDPSTTLVQYNTFQGAGMDISETNPGTGVINILNNQFVPVSPAFDQSLAIKYNYDSGRTINVDGNNFSGHGKIGIISGASQNVNVTNNTFTPAAGAANFTHVLMSSSYPTGGAPLAISGNSILLTGNNFNSAAGATGRGIDFQNGNNTGSTFGTITVGGAGALSNKFAAGLTEFIRLAPTPLAPLFSPASNPSPAPFNVNIDATQNQFDVGSGLQLPSTMTLPELFSLEDKILHKVDVGSLGFVTTVTGQVFVTTNSFLAPYSTYASIQRGVDSASSGNTIYVQAGTYTEQANQTNPLGASYPSAAVLVNKSVTIQGVGAVTATTPNSPVTASPGLAIFDISAPNVTLNNLNLDVQQSHAGAGIQAFSNFGGLAVTGVTIRSFGSGAVIAQGAWLPGSSTYGIVVANIDGGSPAVAITNTSVLPNNLITPTSFFGRAVYLQGVVSTVTGVLGTHTFIGLGQDFQLTTPAAGTSTVSGMTFPAAGASVFGTSAGATVNLTGNVFDQPSAGLPGFPDKSLLIADSQAGTVNVTGNQFTNVQTNKIALISGRSKNVNVTGNTFSAAPGATNFTYIVMSTGYPTSSPPPTSISDNGITIKGNTFNGGSTVTGRALDFQNGNSVGAGWGPITIGGAAPADRNSFGANLGEFIRLSPAAITTPTFSNPAPGPFTPNLNVAGNLFDVGSGLQLPATFTMADNFAMENKVFHKIDNSTVGLVIWTPNQVFVTPAAVPTATDNDYTRLNNAIYAVSNGYTINLSGTFNWAEPFAAASWALGSDGTASTYDDYAILVPANLNSITFTAPAGLGTATIQGPGDLASVNLEGTLEFITGNGPGVGYANSTNQGWTISNLQIFDFDLGIGFFLDGASQNLTAFSGTTIQNNTIRVPVDLNATVAPIDVNQNIGIHLSVGTNQTITGNTILFPGSGVSDTPAGNSSSRVGLQSNTTGGSLYNNLQITNNQLIVSGAQSADPETILGIWENSHNHLADITVSGNSFTNTDPANNPVLNRQRAFRVTSHSSGSTTVTYSGNTVNGANIGFQWLAGSNFAGNQPVVFNNNTVNNAMIGALIQSNGSATITNSTFANTGAMLHVGSGIQIAAGSSANINNNNLSIHGLAIGIDVSGSATITSNSIYDNTTGIRFTAGGTGSVTGNNFLGPVTNFLANSTDLRLDTTAGAVSIGAANVFGGGGTTLGELNNPTGYFIDNRSSQAYNLVGTGNTFNWSDGSAWTALNTATMADDFRIEDRLYHALDNSSSGLIRYVAGNVYVTTPGTGVTDETIQNAIDASSSGNTVNVEAGTYVEQVNINKPLTLVGRGMTPGATKLVAPVIFTPNTPIINVAANTNNVTIDNLQTEGKGSAPNVDGISLGSGVNTVQLTNLVTSLSRFGIVIQNSSTAVTNVTLNNVVAAANGNGFQIEPSGKVNTLLVDNSQFNNNLYGFSDNADGLRTDNNADVVGVTIQNSSFSNNQYKGIYLEKIDNSTIGTNVIVTGNGYANSSGAGIDINLKFGTYTTLTLSGITATNNYSSGLAGNGITVKARNDNAGSPVLYSSNPAYLGSLQLTNVSVTTPAYPGVNALSIGNNVNLNGITMTGVSLNGTGSIGLTVYESTPGQTLNIGNTTFAGTLGNYIVDSSTGTVLIGTGATYGGLAGAAISTPILNAFNISDKIIDSVDVGTFGKVVISAGNVYVTPLSYLSPLTTFADIQRGVNTANTGDTVWVQRNSILHPEYNNDVVINKANLSLIGEGFAGAATTIIKGVAGNALFNTVEFAAPNVTVAGFEITRSGNNTTDWNDPTLNSQGVGIFSTGATLRDNLITQNRNGMLIDGGAANVTIRNNVITDNRTGVHVYQVNGLNIEENEISNNWTLGILFRNVEGVNTTTAPITVFNNSIFGNWYAGIDRRWTNTAVEINASGNWFGTNNPTYAVGAAGEPGYSVQIPVAFGGSSVPPGSAPDIIEATSTAQVDFTPFLWTGVDTNVGAYADSFGFQGNFSNLGITTQGAQTQPVSRIQEGYNLLPVAGGTLHVLGGTYAGNVATGAKPTIIDIGAPATSAQVTINGSLTLTPSTTVNFNLSGPAASSPVGGTDYDQIVTTGATDVGGATFNITKDPAYFPNLGANFALIRSTLSKTGTFNYGGTVAENAVIAVDGISFLVNYNLGSGPYDLNLGVVIPNNIVYVWDGWAAEGLGDYYQPSPLVNTLAAPPGGYATFSGTPVTYGYNAYSTIQAAINAVTTGGIIRIYTGTYAQDITVPSGKNNLQLVAFGATGTRTINGVVGGPSATVTLNGTGTIFSGNSSSDNFVVNQTASDNLAGIRTSTGALGSTISYVNVAGTDTASNFSGVDVGASTWVNYSNGSIVGYRTGIKVNNNAGTVTNPVDIQNSTINSSWGSLTVMPAGVDVGLNGFARLTNNNVISGNRWGVRVLGGTAMLQGNNLSGNNYTGASAAGLFVANGGVVDAGQVGGVVDYTGLGISTGGNNFATGYSMGGAQAIVNLNANFGGAPTGSGNLTDGTNISARNNTFSVGATSYGNIERIVNHAIDNNFQGYVDYRNATSATLPTQEGATAYTAASPVIGSPANQRSIIRSVQFVIDAPVTMQAGAVNVIRTDSSDPMFDMDNQDFYLSVYGSLLPVGSVPLNVTSAVSGTTGRTTVNITFQASSFTTAGSLVDGFYSRNVNASLVDLLFAGSGTNYNNAPVTTAQKDFHRLFGDVNGDQFVDAFDSARFQNAYRVFDSSWAQFFDYNNTGSTFFDAADLTQFNLRLGGGIL